MPDTRTIRKRRQVRGGGLPGTSAEEYGVLAAVQEVVSVAVRHEREACAALVEGFRGATNASDEAIRHLASEIRERGSR